MSTPTLEQQQLADSAKSALLAVTAAQGASRQADIGLMSAVKASVFANPSRAARQALLDTIEERAPGFLAGALGEFKACSTYASLYTPADFSTAYIDCEVVVYAGQGGSGIVATRAPYQVGRETQVVADRAAAEAARDALEAADEAAGKTLLPA